MSEAGDGAVILWHPTYERAVAALAQARRALGNDLDVLVVLAPDREHGLDLGLIDRLPADAGTRFSLLLRGEQPGAVGYALLRRLQRAGWTLALAYRSDDLIALRRDALEALETAIELAQRFRLEVDFFLTLPGERRTAADAGALHRFLVSNRVRRVSFAYPLLLSALGLEPSPAPAESAFFPAFAAAWRQRPDSLHVDDVHRLAGKLIARRAGRAGDRPSALFVDPAHCYRDVDGPVPQLRLPAPEIAGAAGASRGHCRGSCAYFPVCGGDLYGPKHLFNGTLGSAHNPYCDLVAKPLFDHLLGA